MKIKLTKEYKIKLLAAVQKGVFDTADIPELSGEGFTFMDFLMDQAKIPDTLIFEGKTQTENNENNNGI